MLRASEAEATEERWGGAEEVIAAMESTRRRAQLGLSLSQTRGVCGFALPAVELLHRRCLAMTGAGTDSKAGEYTTDLDVDTGSLMLS